MRLHGLHAEAAMTDEHIHGLPEMLRRMQAISSRQAPFAMAMAMTKTVRQAKEAEDAHIMSVFDRPTNFTKRAVAFEGANKRNLQARVFVKDDQAKYLAAQAHGGARKFKPFEEQFAGTGAPQVALPGRGAQLNQFGNLSKAKIKRIAQDLNSSGQAKRFFKGKPKGQDLPAGIYARTNNNKQLTPLLVFANAAVYQKRFNFSELAKSTITAQFESNLVTAWAAAMRTSGS
jgi:hypothetical protein